MNQDKNKGDLKRFFIKLISITLSIIIIINITYNMIFAEKFESVNKLLNLNDKENIELFKNKLRSEVKKGLEKDKILHDEDKILLYKFYLKLKEEFKDVEKN
tara:strand:+ start:3773 stop:4078 length:306 start_codon:yes stop_codon:yes gene_type:complete